MALNLTSRLQVTAHYFWNRRNAAALSHHGVRLDYDPEQRRLSALILGYTLTVLAIALAALMAYIKPAGQVGKSAILANRDTGALYVMVDGRLHPALNLTSARLISGNAANPTFVKSAELDKYPQGPTVGIVGAPTEMPLHTGLDSQWAVCDTAPSATATASAGQSPTVTAIAGPLTLGRRSAPLAMPNALLATHNDKTFVIWDGHRSEIDLGNKAVALSLGVDSAAPKPIPMSTALYDAIPATDPLVIPAVPGAGQTAPWDLGRGAVVGSVLSVHDVQQVGGEALFVVLPDGVQHISPFVASLLRAANSFGDLAPVVVTPDRLAPIPVVGSLPVSYYPSTRLHLVDTTVNATTCLAWAKGATDRAAKVAVLSGQGLPVAADGDERLVHLVDDARNDPGGAEADQVYLGRGATNLVMTTNADPGSVSRDALWWISEQGVRYGIALDDSALRALGIATASARQAPWVLIRAFAPGPALSREDALTQHDSLAPAGGAEALPTKSSEH
ncbi:type VII secretion protein EccB [Mycobacterium intracellulare]|uniref:type VII secretion protein EccB n=1 Tax=Mycobacterium intracellulare TaxID=1767 RepID=UPI0006CA93B2|nr:type VII secretion protein EccB [Mycobacterium intracellulare]KPN47688.1 type VII secretion protein EccB, actinobacterial [Mycobacterium intracellulare subsp. chimaera]